MELKVKTVKYFKVDAGQCRRTRFFVLCSEASFKDLKMITLNYFNEEVVWGLLFFLSRECTDMCLMSCASDLIVVLNIYFPKIATVDLLRCVEILERI